MSIVNFSIPKVLERRIKNVMTRKGFPSKAELFRFAVMRYVDDVEQMPLDNNHKIAALSQQLEEQLNNKIDPKSLPSIKKQLSKLKTI